MPQKNSTSISTPIICRQIAVLWLCLPRRQCTNCIIVSTLQFAALMLWLTTLTSLICFFYSTLRLTIFHVEFFFFFCFHPQENPYLLFHPRFSLILFVLSVFKLIVLLAGLKAAWHFHYRKCSLAVWLSQIL